MARKGKKSEEPKDPFADLGEEFKAKVRAADETEVRMIIANKAMFGAEMAKARREDQHLKECKEALKEASALYTETAKDVKLSIAFCRDELKGRGKEVPEIK
jgi:transposase-like protein